MKVELSSAELQVLMAPSERALSEVIRLNAEVARLEARLGMGDANAGPVMSNAATLKLLTSVCAALSAGQKINAIKIVREATSCGLKEAKDVVEGNYPAASVRY